jgi:GTP diphosphokinase / guanosine-3',5'-bis(diphosphate) 3'-diphosphatase
MAAMQDSNPSHNATPFDAELAGLIDRLHKYYPHFDTQVVRAAFEIAQVAHLHQTNLSGEPYIMHPIAVAHILIDLKLDPASVAAGLLHDVVEDSDITLDEIGTLCSPEIAAIVDGVTKVKSIEGRSKEDAQAGSHRKMFIAMADDPRVVLIKLAEQMHHMRTLHHMPAEKQQRISRETLEIYAPLASRLGIWQMKWELEDLAFLFLYPDEYEKISRELQLNRETRVRIIQRVVSGLHHELDKAGINAETTGRAKHMYSIWQKIINRKIPLNEMNDVIAVRVIVNSKEECYDVLSLAHQRWQPIPHYFADYIATPKESMYQSLHTTILLPGGQPCEIQIRTREMHEIAEHGIAAHWRYKEGRLFRRAEATLDAKIQWLSNLIAWRHELDEDADFVETVKDELSGETVYVFTPKGKIIDLPRGSTPVDFAFRIHSDVGYNCIGARVLNRKVPLHYQLQNGDMVAITTSKQPRAPSREWLEFVKTARARKHIRRFFRRQDRGLMIAAGHELLKHELKRLRMKLPFDEIAETNGYKTVDDLFFAIGTGEHQTSELLQQVRQHKKGSPEVADPLFQVSKTDQHKLVNE